MTRLIVKVLSVVMLSGIMEVPTLSAQHRDTLAVSAREMYLACSAVQRAAANRAADSVSLVLDELAKSPPADSLDELHVLMMPTAAKVEALIRRVRDSLEKRFPSASVPGGTALANFCRARLPESYGVLADGAWKPWDAANTPSRGVIHETASSLLESFVAPGDGEAALLSVVPIQFDSGSAALKPLAKVYLARVADYLRRHPDVTIDAAGFADAVGSQAGNDTMATRRVRAVVAELGRLRIDPARVQRTSYGKTLATRPATDISAKRQVDRRVQLSFSDHAAKDREAIPLANQAHTAPGGDITSTILLGVTEYLKSQAADEARSYLLGRFAEQVCTGSRPVGVTYLVSTCHLLVADSNRDKWKQNFIMPGPSLMRDALASDLQRLPYVQLVQIAQASPSSATRDRVAVLQYAFHVTSQLVGGHDVETVVGGLNEWEPPVPRSEAAAARLSGLLRFAEIASYAATGRVELSRYWQAAELPMDTLYAYAIKAYLVNHPSSGRDLGWIERVAGAARQFDQYVALADTLRLNMREAHDSAGSPSSARQVAMLASFGSDLWLDVLSPQLGQPDTELDSLLRVADALAASMAAGSFSNALLQLQQLTIALAPQWDSTRNNMRVLALATEVAQAKSADEVTQALEKFGGAYAGLSRKHDGHAGRYSGVNAYLGLVSGYERVVGTVNTPDGWVLGAYAPIVYEWGSPRSHFRAFVQLLDVGALASTRISSSDHANDGHVRLVQVVSPGVGAGWGLGDSPFVLGGLVSYNIEGRTVSTESGDITRNALRTSIFAGVDVPLFVH